MATARPAPIEPSGDGRDRRGRFAPGNPGGVGNPHARRVAALRAELLGAVTAKDLRAVVRALVARAKEGDPVAIKLLFAYVLGPPPEAPVEIEERAPTVIRIIGPDDPEPARDVVD